MQLFTYSVPSEMLPQVQPGVRVYVPLGPSRKCTGVVVRLHDEKPQGYRIRSILQVLDAPADGSASQVRPSLLPEQMKLLDWMSDYYLCSKGDAMKAMLPAAMRPESGDKTERFKPHTETYVRLVALPAGDALKRSRKGAEMLEKFLLLAAYDEVPENPVPVSKRALLKAYPSVSALNTLVEKGVLETYQYEVGRLPQFKGHVFEPNTLNALQQKAFNELQEQFQYKQICLLHGVTASGKTEVYIHLIKEQLEAGKQVLFLLPEIALTLHMLQRLQRIFGAEMGVYHSRCSNAVRVETWQKQLSDNPYRLIVGARSAVMLPFRNLGLVIVDEEHEPSYKQEDPAPRYNGRNVAMVLARQYGAKVLLGSATPSIETYNLALTGRYGLAVMDKRYKGIALPEIHLVDTGELRHKKIMKGLFSPLLREKMAQAFEAGEQVILFQNRRGYSSQIECRQCGWIPKCDSCDVSLTYHRRMNMLSCHYCGKTYHLPATCPNCSESTFGNYGFGTERVEEEIQRLFPGIGVLRLDLDTATTTASYEHILQEFQDGQAQVLIGTQMVTKGLDFDRVSVVGIIKADAMLAQPDFRAIERSFQMMSQVAGRAGRKHHQGSVVIQSGNLDNPVFHFVKTSDYVGFYNHELAERMAFGYPPSRRIIEIWLRSSDESQINGAAVFLAQLLRQIFAERVLGPDAPAVARVQMQFLRKVILKIERDTATAPVRQRLLEVRQQVEQQFRQVSIFFDVDPL